MVQSSCGGKNGKLNEMIEVSVLWCNMRDHRISVLCTEWLPVNDNKE